MKFYLIKTTDNEYNASYKYIAMSLKEAEAHIMEYCDWYTNMGTCEIHEVDEKFHVLRKFRYDKGKRTKYR